MNNRELFFRHLAQTSDFPLAVEVAEADGIYIYGTDGKKYIDLISGIAVTNIGHRHPHVVKALKEQLDKHLHLMVYGEYIQTPQVKLAELLTSVLPKNLNNVFFVNSGSEAVEGALKLAKRHTGRTELVSFTNAYHGSTHGSLSVTGNESLKNSFRPLLPDVRTLEFNNIEMLGQITDKTACVIVEPIQGEAGAIVPDTEFLQALRKRCSEVGALLIFDEIQCGLGRTGSLWAFEQFDVVPDVLLLAKAMGGGLPIGAFISSKEIMQCLTNKPVLGHITTFGGNPLCATAALANLEVIINEKLWERAIGIEKAFKDLLSAANLKIRGRGALLALEFDSFETNKRVIDQCVKNGLLTDWFLFADNCMRIAPPLIIDKEQVENACAVILGSL